MGRGRLCLDHLQDVIRRAFPLALPGLHTHTRHVRYLVGWSLHAISIDTASAQGKQKGRRLDDHEGGYLQNEAWSVYDGQIGAVGVLSPQDNWLSGYCACTAITMGDLLGST